MSAELNVKLVLDTSDLQNQLSGLQRKIGGSLKTPSEKVSPASKSSGISATDAFAGMLRSLAMYRAIAEALKLMREAIMAVVGAFQKAQKLYVGGALSGYGTRLQTQRGVVAEILGIGEQDVLRFAKAYKTINKELKLSIETIAQNAKPLSETNMQWKMLSIEFQALASDLAIKMKPAIDGFIDGLSILIGFLKENSSTIINIGERIAKSSPLYWVAKISQMAGAASAGANPLSGLDSFKTPLKKVGEIVPQMKQLPASAWEKMGLVIGAGGGVNYAKDTAHNTKKTNQLLDKLTKLVSSGAERGSILKAHPQMP